MCLAQDEERGKEVICWELKELDSLLLPQANKMSQYINNRTYTSYCDLH